MQIASELEGVLQNIVTNKNLITPEVVSDAVRDMEDIVKEKDIATPFMLDIATYRFFIRVNAKAPQSVVDSYKEAIERLKSAPIKAKGAITAYVGKRESVWI